jgi:hypothetical protein
MDKVYHIYAKGKCIYHNLPKNKFEETWEMMHRMIEVLDVKFKKEDLQYEELAINKEIINASSF